MDYNHGVFDGHKDWHGQARSHKMSINAWTVNNVEDMKKMLDLGIDQLTTDYPLEARDLMKQMKIKELK